MRLAGGLVLVVPFFVSQACTGGDPDIGSGTTNDGGPSGVDATNDAVAPDAAGGEDAPTDAGVTWCTSQTGKQFCSDFDRSPFDDGWTRFESLGGVVTANISDFVTSPRAMMGTVPSGAGSMSLPIQAALGHVLNVTPGIAEASFSMRVRTPTPALATGDAVVVAEVAAGDASFVFLQYQPSGFVLISGTGNDAGVNVALVSQAPKLDQWVAVRIVVTFRSDATGSMEAFFDGVSVARKDTIVTLVGSPPTVGLALGPTVYEKSPGLVVEYDNVLFDNL